MKVDKTAKIIRGQLVLFLVAAFCANGDAIARTITVDAIDGTSATVTVSAGETGEHLRFAYGSYDGGTDFAAWDFVTPSLAEVPAEGGTFNVTLPFAPITAAEAPCWRFVTAPPYNCVLDAIYGNGSRYFDTGLTNSSSDTVVIRVVGDGASMVRDSKYHGLYGARTAHNENNISAFISPYTHGATYYLDFNNATPSVATSYRIEAVVNIDSSDVFVMTSTNSASVRALVTNSVNGVEISNERNVTQWIGDFDCDYSAYLFHVNGAPDDWRPAMNGIAFNYCRVSRGDEVIADLVPVVADDGTTAIYDIVRNVFAAKLGGGNECAAGTTNRMAVISAASALGHSSDYCDISLRLQDSGDLKINVAAGAVSGALVMAYGADDKGGDVAAWDSAIVLAAISSGETFAIDVPFPIGWGDTVKAMRFFATDREFRLASDGNSYIDTAWTNCSDHVVEMVFQLLAPLPSNARALYGCRNAAGDRNVSMFVDASNIALDFNNGSYANYRLNGISRDAANRYRLLNSTEKRIAEWSQNGVVAGAKTNNTTYAFTFTCAGSAYLFAANDMSGGSPAVLWSGNGLQPINFYSLKVWTTDGTLRSDIVPCKIDGTAKVYDCVRKRYFDNVGSGSFTFAVEGSNSFFGDTGTITPSTKIKHNGFVLIFR